MKKKKLKKISAGKYDVDKENSTTYLGDRICNFYIKDFMIISNSDVLMKFRVTLASKEEETTKDIPIELLCSPVSWLAAYFDNSYKKFVKNNLFDTYMGEILDMIIEELDEEELYDDNICGWSIGEDRYDFAPYSERDAMYEYLNAHDKDIFSSYLNSPYKRIVIPMIAYTFLSVLSSLDILGENNRVNIIMSLTGSNERVRNKLALMFANLFERSKNLSSAHYRHIHVYSDNKAAAVRMKSMCCKDSVLIAFNPHKKQCNTLYKIYSPFERSKDDIDIGLLLIVMSDCNDIPFKTVNINIPDDFDVDACAELMYFEPQLGDRQLIQQYCDIDYAESLMQSLYDFCRAVKSCLKRQNKMSELFDKY